MGSGAPVLWGASLPSNTTSPALLRSMFETAAATGFNTIRALAVGVDKEFALATAPGAYSETAFRGLDFAIATAASTGLRPILALTTNWGDTGSVDQFVGWAGAGGHSSFFTDTRVHALYLDHVAAIANRVNRITGVRFADDPTIMAWNLINEPRCTGCAEGAVASWVASVAPAVKKLLPRQLLTVGSEGFYGRGDANRGANPSKAGAWADNEGQSFPRDHAPDAIDFASIHVWPNNWKESPSLQEGMAFQTRWIAAHIDDAATLGKPLLLEEFGAWLVSCGCVCYVCGWVSRERLTRVFGWRRGVRESWFDVETTFPSLQPPPTPPHHPQRPDGVSSLDTRNALFTAATKQVVASASAGGPLEGLLFWSWLSPGSEAPRSEGGDRGLYGVRPSDAAFEIVASAARALSALPRTPVDGCVLKADGHTPSSVAAPCTLFKVRGLPSTGREGPGCALDIDECSRGTHDCGSGAGAVCANTDGGFRCACRWGYAAGDEGCTPTPALANVTAGYESDGPSRRACAGGDPLPYPVSAPGAAPSANATQARLEPARSVTLDECLQACEAAPGCAAADYNERRGRCLLRGAGGTRRTCVDKEVFVAETDQSMVPMRFSDGTYETFFRKGGVV